MKIDAINYPWAFTDTGERIPVEKIKGQPYPGALLNDNYEVIGKNVDENCINGVCSIPLPENRRTEA